MIPFSPPYIDNCIIEAVTETLNSGWITTGPKTKKFEHEIAKFCNISHVLAVNSWTAGAELLLRWFGIQPGDEIIIPAYTYCATANIIIHCGATPVMVDVAEDFCIDIEAVKKAITSKTKAIIPVDIGGLPVNYNALNKVICENRHIFQPSNKKQQQLNKILLLADAAHSFGGIIDNAYVGASADFTVFSFHAVKNLTTAEGGAICINLPEPFDNNEVYKELNIWSLHGQTKDAFAKTQKGAWEYDVITSGYKCNMTDILASIGLVELKRYKSEILVRRKQIVEKYNSILGNYEWALLPTTIDLYRESSYHLYLLRIKGCTILQRNEIIKKIFDKGVSVNVHYKPLPELTFYKNLGYDINDFTMSKKLWEGEISLPVYISLTDEQISYIGNVIVESYNETIV